jgi:6-pyruvoyltetrahydropterin/6-carboxytetrahydropterin synthase
MAHRLLAGGSPKCMTPHGHNEIVSVRLVAARAERLNGDANMVESFERAKGTWHRWIDEHVDHALQLSEDDPLLDYFECHEPRQLTRLLVCPGDPTTEVLAACFMAKLSAFLAAAGGRLRCAELAIEETPTNKVTLCAPAEAALPLRATAGGASRWWQRPDMSINDLPTPVGVERARHDVALALT